MRTLRAAAIAFGPPLAAAVVGGIGSRNAKSVYAGLDKPAWAPPPELFGPVWTALYGGIGVAAWRMRRREVPPRTWVLHGTQLTFNAAWTWAFFERGDRRLALGVIAALDALVAAEVADVAKRDKAAAALLTPYLAWSLYATALNASVSDPR